MIELEDVLAELSKLRTDVHAALAQSNQLGESKGLVRAADFIDAVIRETGLSGEVLAVLLVIRSNLTAMATALLTEESAECTPEPPSESPTAPTTTLSSESISTPGSTPWTWDEPSPRDDT